MPEPIGIRPVSPWCASTTVPFLGIYFASRVATSLAYPTNASSTDTESHFYSPIRSRPFGCNELPHDTGWHRWLRHMEFTSIYRMGTLTKLPHLHLWNWFTLRISNIYSTTLARQLETCPIPTLPFLMGSLLYLSSCNKFDFVFLVVYAAIMVVINIYTCLPPPL